MDMPAKIVQQHHSALRALSNRSWKETAKRQSRRELFGAVTMAAMAATALLSVILLMKYQGSIPVVSNTIATDRFGQVIAKDTTIARIPAQVSAHSVIYWFMTDTFSIFDSAPAMQMNAKEALSLVSSENVAQTVRAIWSNGPLKADGTWVQPVGERHIKITSVLQRGDPTTQGTEYEVDFDLQNVNAPNPPSAIQHYKADLVLASGGQQTDIDVAGLAITHFTFGVMK